MKRLGFLIKTGSAALKYHLFKIKTPVNLMLSVTDRCNSRCRYCSVSSFRVRPELSTSRIFRLIDEFSSSGGSRIALYGGEPLLREDIGEIIRFCKKKGLLTSLDTNGYLVPEKIKEIQDLDVLVVSFDGGQAEHDANREEGSYKKVMDALEAARGKMLVWTITVLTKYNLNSIDFILDKAKALGFYTTWQVLHHQALGSRESRQMFPSREDYRSAIRLLMERKKEKSPIVNSLAYFKYLYDWPDFEMSYSGVKRGGLPCYAGKLYCNIDTDGRLYPCSVLIGLVPAKSATEGFKKAFVYTENSSCQSCSGGCFIEYNNIYSLRPQVIINWLEYISKSYAGKS